MKINVWDIDMIIFLIDTSGHYKCKLRTPSIIGKKLYFTYIKLFVNIDGNASKNLQLFIPVNDFTK